MGDLTIEKAVNDEQRDRGEHLEGSDAHEHFALRDTSRCHESRRLKARWRPIWERQNLVTVEVRASNPDDPIF